MLNFIFEIVWDVISMCYVTDTGQGHCLHELISERGQISFDAPHDKAVLFGLQLIIKLLVQVVSDTSMMVWPKVALLAAVDVPSRDEVQEGGYRGKALIRSMRQTGGCS